MTSLKLLSQVFSSLLTLILLFGLLVITLDYMNVSFTIDGARRTLVEQIKSYSGRDVRIDGEVELSISFPPRLLVEQIHISNIVDFADEDFITISEARVEVPLWPLLSGHIHISDIAADQAKINLIQKKDGRHNWSFDTATLPSSATDTIAADKSRHVAASRLSMGVFQLTNVAIVYSDESRDQVIDAQLDRLLIDIKDRTKPIAEMSGKVQGFPYSVTLESDALEILLSGKPWLLHGSGHIADKQTEIEANVQLKEGVINGNLNVNVKKVNLGLLLDTLGIISGQDAATDNINLKAKVRGSDLAELYEQAEIKLQLGKGYWHLQATETEKNKELVFSRASSFTSWEKPVELHIDGIIAGEAIKIDFKTNRLLELFDEVQTLDIDLVSSIADTEVSMKGTLNLPIKTQQFQLDIAIKGKDLEKLNPIINSEFPPFNDFSLAGNLQVSKKAFILKSASASIGDTRLQSSIVVERQLAKPLWSINLYSEQLQLNDFTFDDWKIKQTDSNTKVSADKTSYDRPLLKPLHQLEDIMRTPEMHLNLNLNVDRLLTGQDLLGKARFQLHLRDDALGLNNLDIEIPGGRIGASASFEADGEEISGNIKLDIDKLDYGIATRFFKLDSQVDGVISFKVDLQLGGSDFTRLLDHADGKFDVVAWPKNTKPVKVLNLWATNLYLILLPELKKKESLVNCIVALTDLDDGVMKEELFAIDTTKLWIYGNMNVDFKQEYIELSLFPQSKTARFFSLQTPIRAQGSFSNIGLSINPVDLAGSYISFITSPLHVPTRWIFGDKVPEDGSAVCDQLFDRNYTKKLKSEIDKKEKKEVDELLQSY